jgi:putative ABC transport system permease protein
VFISFIKTAIRFLWRNKTYSVLNFLCLTFGLTCAIVSVLNVTRVLNYDRFHKNYDRLYEVEAQVSYFNGDQFPKEPVSASLPDLLMQNASEIETISRIVNRSHLFINGNESFPENGIYADPDFLEMFTFPLVRGTSGTVLKDNNSIVISERLANKFFKTTDCIGKTMIIKEESGQDAFTISGVMKNVPYQSYLQFDFIIPFAKFLSGNIGALEPGASSCQVWAALHEDASVKTVNEKIRNLIKGQETTLNQELFLFPLKEKILYYYSGGRRIWREMQYVVTIACIGFAILLIACFNFINLTIALNIRRYRDAGIRKVFGAQKLSIVMQHLGESALITLISLLISIELVRVVLVALNRAFNSAVQFDFTDFRIILIFAVIALFTAIASGILPALYLSSSRPVSVLKGKLVTSHSFSLFRQGLIVFQFTIPVILIIFVMIMKVQDSFLQNYDLGFNQNSLIIIASSEKTEAHAESVRTDLLSIPGIESVSFSNCIPARGSQVTNDINWEGKDASQKLHFWSINTDFSYDRTVNLRITEGRYFDKSYPSDSACFVINDIAAKVMGYENPVGRTLTMESRKGTVIGVFRDFHTLDLSGPYTPTIISLAKTGKGNILVKLAPGINPEIRGKIKDILNKYDPGTVFQANLYSDLYQRTELSTTSDLVGLAFIISILLACLGLTGLASFTAASRTKEIGIRKINGASVISVMRLLGFNYSRWFVIASLISIPFAFLLGNVVLSRFNFRTAMPYWAFIAGPLTAYFIALAAVSWQSWRAAARNPVEALRYE